MTSAGKGNDGSVRMNLQLQVAYDQTHAEPSVHLAVDDQVLYTMIAMYIDDWTIQTFQHRRM